MGTLHLFQCHGSAIGARVKRLGLIHHNPNRIDDDLNRQVEFCRERIRQAGCVLECVAIAEGMLVEV